MGELGVTSYPNPERNSKMYSNETVTRLAESLASVWLDLYSEDFRSEVSAETKRIELVEEANALGVSAEVYSLANRILNGNK